MDKTLLIVEDDAAIAAGLRDFLESENYVIRTSSDGESALVDAFKFLPDLILLDVSLPRLSGFDVCRKLRQGGFVNPVVMLTSRAELVDKVVGLEAGADDYLTKPFELRELLARIRAHTRRGEGSGDLPSSQVDDSGVRRRLLAIMFSDIEGYSRLMHHDEARGIAMLREHNVIMDACVESFAGRVVEVVGDAYLVAFENVAAAVECAVAAQERLTRSNPTNGIHAGIPVRIGIHAGDVAEFDGGVKGDAVNIAKRIQEIAREGSVTVSNTVHSMVRARMPGRFTSIGTREMKNITEGISLFEVNP